jgi:hypothetical protein
MRGVLPSFDSLRTMVVLAARLVPAGRGGMAPGGKKWWARQGSNL